jgi:AcrR family transcriptional regulator
LEAAASDAVQRRQIAEATCRLIARGGLEDATFRRIAAELGATTGLISHYFVSKADLLVYAINYAQEQLAAGDLPNTWSTKEAFFDDLCRALTASEGEAGVFWRVWIAFLGVALSDDDVRSRYLAWDDHYRREMIRLVRNELGQPVSHDEAELLADALNVMASGIGIFAVLDPQRLDSRRVRAILEISFQGVLAVARDRLRQANSSASGLSDSARQGPELSAT